MKYSYPEVHASEYSWAGTDFDYVFPNNSTVGSLYQQVNNLVQDLHGAKVSRFG